MAFLKGILESRRMSGTETIKNHKAVFLWDVNDSNELSKLSRT